MHNLLYKRTLTLKSTDEVDFEQAVSLQYTNKKAINIMILIQDCFGNFASCKIIL